MKNKQQLFLANKKLDEAYVSLQETQELLEELLALTEGLKALNDVAEKQKEKREAADNE